MKSLAQEVMLFRLKGAPQKWMIQQMKQHYGIANDLHALIGIKLTEKAFKYEIPRDQSGRSALIKTLQLITTMNVRNPFQIVINLKKKIKVLTHPWKGKF